MAKNNINKFRGDDFDSPGLKFCIKEEPLSPCDDFEKNLDLYYRDECSGIKRSLSMSDLAEIRNDLLNLEIESNQQELQRRHRSHTSNTPQVLPKTKFVSMAEAIYHYQRDTPKRFYSSKANVFRTQSYCNLKRTVPQSPMLRCKQRSRPAHVISQKEKEEMEIKEIKNYKIKANPIPKSVLEGASLPNVTRKPNTVLEPFHLTEVPKKEEFHTEPIPLFKARPVPKQILEKPVDNAMKQQQHVLTQPEPFSFEKRDEEVRKRKEAKVKQQIEEEKKKASQFKAHPVSNVVKKVMQHTTMKAGSSSTSSSSNKENLTKFEARPPTVLYKEPFKPVLKTVQLVKPVPFDLSTTKRAAEREKFDKQLKEKELQQELMMQEREKQLKEMQKQADAEMRAKLVHHPKPIPMHAPYIPQKSTLPLTVPSTPKFIRRMKHNS